MKKQNIFIKLLSLLLCITLVSPTAIQAASLGASESVSGHWAEETLTYWDMLGLFDEIPDDEFGIDKAISRGAFVYLFNTMLGIGQTENTAHNFTDIAETDWNYTDIVTAYNTGYISGYPDNTFRADSPITREEMCTIISRYFTLDKVYDDNKLQNFTDKEKIQSYALDHIGALAELETVNGYPDGSFKPQNNITYAEAVTIITRFLGYINGGSGVSGRIYYEGKPVYNAEITVYNHDANEIAVQDTSDVYGDYILDISAGMYDIVVAKNGTVSMISGVEVGEDTRTYNKIILEAGQYVTGVLADENKKTLAETEFYIKGETYVTVVTDENGEFTVILPVDGDYVILAEVNGKLTEITEFRTRGTEDGLDLGTVVVSTGEKTAKTEGTTIKPPLWYLNSMIQDAINKDENDTEEDDTEEDDTEKDDNDKIDEDETPEFDYSSLPYREPKTMAELVELNGGKQPTIFLNDDNTIGLYDGRISDKKIENVYDVIAELNNVADLYGFEDSRIEYIPYGQDGKISNRAYKLHQVYDGVIILSTFLTVSIDNQQYISGITGTYNSQIKYIAPTTSGIISNNDCQKIITNYFSDKLNVNNIEINSNNLVIDINGLQTIYYCQVSNNHRVWNVKIDALTGNILSCSRLENSFNNYSLFYGYDNGIFTLGRKSILDYAPSTPVLSCGYNHNIFDVDINDDNYNIFTSATYNAEVEEIQLYNDIATVYNTYSTITNHDSVDGNDNIHINAYLTDKYYNPNTNNFSDFNNAVALTEYYDGKQILLFDSDKTSLITVGHEYTHAVQKNIIKYIDESNIYGGFTADYSEIEKISSNINWVESQAISEGTADIMGILINCIEDQQIQTDNINYNDDSYEIKESDENHHRTYDYLIKYYTKEKETKVPGCTKNDICYVSNDSLTYMSGVGHNDRYICGGILYLMVENGIDNPELLFELWYYSIKKLDSMATFKDLMYSLFNTAKELDMDEYIEEIIISCNNVGIYANVNSSVEKWYGASFEFFTLQGTISENSVPESHLTSSDYIDLVVNFCNESGANITITYDNGVATLTKPIFGKSSHESISLIFDESKDILRWEAFIIAYRILNFCHAEFKDKGWIPLYNYSYEDKKAGTAEYEKFMMDNQLIYDGFYTNNNYEEILEKYYGGMSYEDFHNSYMYVRNNTSDWQTSKYDFGESDTMTETHHIITTVIYNIYRSLGRDFNMITLAPDLSDVVFNEKMTLAHACYLLYSFIK